MINQSHHSLYSFIYEWFPSHISPSIVSLFPYIPESTIDTLIVLLNSDKRDFSFETISNQRIIFTVLRIFRRLFYHFSEPLIIRGEIELTHRCNFNCEYCKTHLADFDKETVIDQDKIKLLIQKYAEVGCKYLHFNGGEISLIDYVPSLVVEAVTRGIKVGASSNGSGDISFYKSLVEAGIAYIHISFDASEKAIFEHLSSYPGSWDQVTSVLDFLCNSGKNINPQLFIVANLVIRKTNLHFLDQTVDFLINLGVDDIKLLPAFPNNKNLNELKNVFLSSVKPKIEMRLRDLDGFNILKMRTNKLFVAKTHGIEENKQEGVACEICTEQTMVRSDGTYAPCYIYMRENYKMLTYGMGTVQNSLDDYCSKANSILSDKYLMDGTCKRFCPDMIRDANYKVQELVTNCVARIIEGLNCFKGTIVGELQLSYKDLEAPFKEAPFQIWNVRDELYSYKDFVIPYVYIDDSEKILSVIRERGYSVERLKKHSSCSCEFGIPNLEQVIQSKIVEIFLSKFERKYLFYRLSTSSIKKEEIILIQKKIDEVIQPRVIQTILCNNKTQVTVSRVPIQPIVGCLSQEVA